MFTLQGLLPTQDADTKAAIAQLPAGLWASLSPAEQAYVLANLPKS